MRMQIVEIQARHAYTNNAIRRFYINNLLYSFVYAKKNVWDFYRPCAL